MKKFGILLTALGLFYLWGCAGKMENVRAPEREKGEISAAVQPAPELEIYSDHSTGRRYDQYSAIVLCGQVATMITDSATGDIIVLDSARVVIVGEKIDTVLRKGEKFPPEPDSASALFIHTGGIIFPGLINIHDHMHYNTVGLWQVPKKYTNRYQWPRERSLKTDVKYAKYLLFDKKYCYMPAEAMKYAEVKHLVAGETAVQGSPMGASKFCDILVRNLDVWRYFGQKKRKISPYVRNVTEVKDDKIRRWIEKMDAGELDALFFHIAEGTDDVARAEFDFLIEKGLARKQTIIIHGTALDERQIKYMADHDMTLVWSPASNLLLYGETAKIPLFKKYGVKICLGTDWSPSGGKNLLNEMKIAYQYAKHRWGDTLLTPLDLAKMVTCNPADAINWSEFVGRIKPGLYADIMVIRDGPGDPFEDLLNATEKDVELVLIGGDPLYGDSAFMVQLKPGDFEYIRTPCGFTKCIDVTKEGVKFGNQKLAYIVSELQKVLSFDPEYLEKKFHDRRIKNYSSFEEYLDDKFPGHHPLRLDPIYPCMDEYYFRTLRESKNANLGFDIEKIYYSR